MKDLRIKDLGHCRRGVTLVELIIAIVVISIALGGVLMVMNFTVRHSADPLVQQQAVAIAEAYLEEILLKPFADPDGVDTGETRTTFDDVDDYNGLSDNGVRDQDGNAVTGLAAYNVAVTVGDATIGPAGQTLTGKRVEVQVSGPGGVSLSLVGYRTDY